MLQRSSLWFPARLLLQPTDCCRYAVNFNKENKRMNQFFFCQTVVVWLDRMSLCALLSTRSRWVTGVNKTKKNTSRLFQRRVMEVFFFLPVNINDLDWFYSCCDVEAPSSSDMNLWSGSDQHLSSAAVSSARWGLGGNCLWETGEQVILTPCGRWGAVKILLPGFPSTDRLTFKRAVKSFTMFRPLKSDVKY